MLSSIAKQSQKSTESVLKKKRKATVGRRWKGFVKQVSYKPVQNE